MRAHCVRARFRDRSRACFIACACDVHSTFKDLIVAERARPLRVARGGELLTWLRCLGAARADHFGAKRWAQLLFEKAPWRGEELQRPLFSPSKTRSVECRATVFLVAWHTGKESVKGTLLPRLINIVVVRRQVDVGLLRTDRPPLTLSWSSGLRRVTTLADEKKVRSFTACFKDLYNSLRMSSFNDLSQLVRRIQISRRPTSCILDRFWDVQSTRRFGENIVDAETSLTIDSAASLSLIISRYKTFISGWITGVQRRVRFVAWLRKWCRKAVNDAFAACVAGYRSHSPEVLHFGPVLNVQHESLGKYRWCSRSLTIDLLQNRASSVWQGIISGWIQWVKHEHVQAVRPTVGLAESACGYDCEQLLLALDHSEELFPKFRAPTSLMVQVKNKTQNWAILTWHWLFWYQSVWLGTTSFSRKWCGWLCMKK